MIKLVVTDIDGTLVEEGKDNLNPEYFQVIRKLTEKGIQFAVASGRHAVSVRRVFGPILDCIWIISQNGNVIEKNGHTQVLKYMPGEWVHELWEELSSYPKEEGIESIINTAERNYCPFPGTKMHHWVTEEYHFNTFGTGGWEYIPDETFSMATIYHPIDCDKFCRENHIYEKWRKRMDVVNTGRTWVDMMMPGINKGSALKHICEEMGINLADSIAFGDNNNDIPLIATAGTGYAVESAKPAVKEAADKVIPGWESDGVLQVLKEILKSQ